MATYTEQSRIGSAKRFRSSIHEEALRKIGREAFIQLTDEELEHVNEVDPCGAERALQRRERAKVETASIRQAVETEPELVTDEELWLLQRHDPDFASQARILRAKALQRQQAAVSEVRRKRSVAEQKKAFREFIDFIAGTEAPDDDELNGLRDTINRLGEQHSVLALALRMRPMNVANLKRQDRIEALETEVASLREFVSTTASAPLPVDLETRLAAIGSQLSTLAGAGVVADLANRLQVLEARPALVYKGVWDPARAYPLGAVVTYLGAAWIAVKGEAPIGERPGAGQTVWQLMVKRGDVTRPIKDS